MSEIGIDGDSNRAAGRDYFEINLANQEREPLAQAQRARLNEEVAKISEELGMDPRLLWRSVHESTGVKTIGEVKKDQFLDAMGALQALRERHQEQARAQTLITELGHAAAERGLGKQLARYCLREFGEQALARLSIQQLTQALRFVDECQAPPQASMRLPDFHRLVMSHPWHFTAVFVLGLSVGRII